MNSAPGPNDETSQELDRYILKTIGEQCTQLGIVNYNPSSLRWSWLTRGTTFERSPDLNHGEIVLFKGFQKSLQRDDWAPQLLYALIRGNMRKTKNTLIVEIFAPILAALIVIPTLVGSVGALIDLLAVLPALFSGAIIYNVILRKQRIAADEQVVEMLGKQALLDSLRSLEAYFKVSTPLENRKKINELATEEFQSSTHLKNKVDIFRDLLGGRNEVEKRIKTVESLAQGSS